MQRFQEDSITVRMSVRGPQHRRVVGGIIRKLRRAGISCVVVEGAGGSASLGATWRAGVVDCGAGGREACAAADPEVELRDRPIATNGRNAGLGRVTPTAQLKLDADNRGVD